jgi:hypothetical protein
MKAFCTRTRCRGERKRTHMKTLLLICITFSLSACMTHPKIQELYDQRLKDPADKKAVQEQMSIFISNISKTAAMPLAGAAYGIKDIELVQKYFCICQRSLGQKCKQAPKEITPEQKELWVKGNAAEAALIATGNESYVDPVLCM